MSETEKLLREGLRLALGYANDKSLPLHLREDGKKQLKFYREQLEALHLIPGR